MNFFFVRLIKKEGGGRLINLPNIMKSKNKKKKLTGNCPAENDSNGLVIHIDEIKIDSDKDDASTNQLDSSTTTEPKHQQEFIESSGIKDTIIDESLSIDKESENSIEDIDTCVNAENTLDSNYENQENIKSNPEVKTKQKNKKIALALFVSTTFGAVGIGGYTVYKEIKEEQLRLSEFKKESLDLKMIVDTVDECGGSSIQLNWQYVASILGVQFNNYPENITKQDVKNIAMLFIDSNNKVKSFDEVVSSLDLKDKEKKRIFDYLDDIKYYGYKPERLHPESKQMQFIESVKSGAIESYKKTGILPSITIAQAILESNWGESNLFLESNNLFGIKADSSWSGEFVTFETKEFHSDMIKDKFRKYANVSESIIDHSNFLTQNPRYLEGGVFNAKTYKVQAKALQESGYSTAQDELGNKTYANMLEQLIRQYNLQLIDSKFM